MTKNYKNTMSDATFVSKIDHLSPNRSVSNPKYGTVKCTCSAKMSKNGKRQFSVSQSKKAANRGGYDFGTLMSAFGLHR